MYSPSWGRTGGVPNDPRGLVKAVLGVEVLQTDRLTSSDVLDSASKPPDRLVVPVHTAAISGCEAARQDVLCCASLEVPDRGLSQFVLI